MAFQLHLPVSISCQLKPQRWVSDVQESYYSSNDTIYISHCMTHCSRSLSQTYYRIFKTIKKAQFCQYKRGTIIPIQILTLHFKLSYNHKFQSKIYRQQRLDLKVVGRQFIKIYVETVQAASCIGDAQTTLSLWQVYISLFSLNFPRAVFFVLGQKFINYKQELNLILKLQYFNYNF